jgi:hypothetical protein
MVPVYVEQCDNGNIYVQGTENGHMIHNGKGTNNKIIPSGNVKENFYLKQAVIHLLRIWIIEGFPQISASRVRLDYIEVMGIRTNVY